MRRSLGNLRSVALGVAAALALTGAAMPAKAAPVEPYTLDVVLPLTGAGAFVGKGQRAMLEALQGDVNATGGIRGRPLTFVFHDDQTSPQVAVQLTTDLMAPHPAVFLGSSLVALCNAMVPLVRDGPVMFCLSPGLHPPIGSYAFSASASSIDQLSAVIRYYRLKGWTHIALLTASDATGQDADRAVALALALPENKDVQLVDHEHFDPSDVSVAAQLAHIKASKAQALIAWITGTSVATAMKGAIEAGLDIPFDTSSGNQTFVQMELYANFLPKQLNMPSALFPEHDGILKLDPRVEAAQHRMYAVLQAKGLKPDNMTATSWDPGLIVVAALRQLGPEASAAQVRQYIASLTDFPGIDGLYNFQAHPDRGLGPDSAALVAYDAKAARWVWLSQPGGAPLSP